MRSIFYSVLSLLLTGWGGACAAGEIVNDITQLNPITVEEVVAPVSVDEVQRWVAHHAGPISIGGGRYSQGGQTATENCLFLDMRKLNRILNLDVRNKRITVQAGIRWREVQEAIDPEGLSLKIMQSFSNFTVGGSLSVNAHGRYVGQGALIHSVRSLKIVLADGSVKEASRALNPDLFHAAIGGYGGIGVIVEATLDLTENTPLKRVTESMPVADYKEYFNHTVRDSGTAVLHHADLYPPDYGSVNAVTWFRTEEPVTVPERLMPQTPLSSFHQSLLGWVTAEASGKRFRKYVYDPYRYARDLIVWRNYEASHDVIEWEPVSRKDSTYVLQEYFIPVAQFDHFAASLADILNRYHVNVLNVSIRHALPDTETWLSWSPVEVFSFVLYYEQKTTGEDKQQVSVWTKALVDAALKEGGTYYLPYQIHASRAQFLKAYPRAPEYFALKRRIDPTYKFRNKLWDRYYRP